MPIKQGRAVVLNRRISPDHLHNRHNLPNPLRCPHQNITALGNQRSSGTNAKTLPLESINPPAFQPTPSTQRRIRGKVKTSSGMGSLTLMEVKVTVWRSSPFRSVITLTGKRIPLTV